MVVCLDDWMVEKKVASTALRKVVRTDLTMVELLAVKMVLKMVAVMAKLMVEMKVKQKILTTAAWQCGGKDCGLCGR